MAATLLTQPRLADPVEPPDTRGELPAEVVFGYGKQEWTIAVGYGLGMGIEGSNDGNLKEIRALNG